MNQPGSRRAGSGWLSLSKPFDFESIAFCKRKQRENIALLTSGSVRHRVLANKLRSCNDSSPCQSEACLFCMRRFRERLLNQSIAQIGWGDWTAASIIPAEAQVAVGSLQQFQTRKFIRRWHKRLERSPFLKTCRVVGGIDISLNNISGAALYWQPHLYLLIGHQKTQALRDAIRLTFPAEPSAPRPYRCRELIDRLVAISYSYKAHFYMRHSYVNDEGENEIDDMPIPPTYKQELLVWLDSHKLGDRLLLRKFRRHGPGLNLLHLP